MPTNIWRQCSFCGAITDEDERGCPNAGIDPEHHLRRVQISPEDIGEMVKRGEGANIFTKHMATLSSYLS